MQRALLIAALATVLGVLSQAQPGGDRLVAVAQDASIVVTSAQDTSGAGGAVCPSANLCTLRRAIEMANSDASGTGFTIVFDSTVFPAANPESIEVGAVPLPNVSRSNVTINAVGVGVVLQGSSASLTTVTNGLTVTGGGFRLLGMHIRGFNGSCVAITGQGATVGEPAAGAGNLVGDCKSGVAVSGAQATIQGNRFGFDAAGGAAPLETAIVIAASDAVVGGSESGTGATNIIGFSGTGIFAGSGSTAAFSGTRIERNSIGWRPDGSGAPVGNGIVLSQPSNSANVIANALANAQSGIAVRPELGGVAPVRNRFQDNVFENINGLAIDLAADAARNVNDDGDADLGPNGLLNHPLISRATPSRLAGTACPGCQVQVYRAAHEPGGERDFGTTPISNGTVVADPQGAFVIENPAAAPGEWLVGLSTDPDGNTSEFGPPSRVGAGAVLCGNVQLRAGWNHVGYFGPEPVALFNSFTPDPAGSVTAIYRAIDGSNEYERWFSTTLLGRTLQAVHPGETYWFFATEPVTLRGGLSLSFPLPVQLKAGWNDFAYLGASAAVADALISLGGQFEDLYRFDPESGRWLRFGDGSAPAWAVAFDQLEACGVYQVRLDEPATLVPLQP